MVVFMIALKVLMLFSLTPLLYAQAPVENANPGQPGTLNYVEGQVSIDGEALTPHSVGNTTLQAGQSIVTKVGRAELLLTPGIYVRVGSNSVLKMISPDLTHTEVRLESGKADVEVDNIYKENNILVDQEGSQARLLKPGLYAFNTPKGTMRVFDGEAKVFPIDNAQDVKPVTVKGSHKLLLSGDGGKPVHFQKEGSQDGLYAWSSLRSEYLGEANENVASEYAGVDGVNPGWFWDPAFAGYTWLPGDGMLFSPFGFGFYSPYYLNSGGFIYGRGGYGYGRGGYGRGGYGGIGRGGMGVYRGGGLRGGHGGLHAGGGGGFHGGGGGGGFHGGGSGGGGGSHGGGGGHR
jgi:hypothetical protein